MPDAAHRRCQCGEPMLAVTFMTTVVYGCPDCDLARSWPVVARWIDEHPQEA